jgi:WD40 repeat protein
MCRVFEEPLWDPDESLAELLTHQYDVSGSKLDATYLLVLNHLLPKALSQKQKDKLVEGFQPVIGAIMVLESPLPVPTLAKLVNALESRINFRLNLLHSVLNVLDDKSLPIRLFHLSERFLAAASANTVMVWETTNFELCHTPEDDSEQVHTLLFSPDNRLLECRYESDMKSGMLSAGRSCACEN